MQAHPVLRTLAISAVLSIVLTWPAMGQHGSASAGAAAGHSGGPPAHPSAGGARSAPGIGGGPHQHLDSRFSHNRYYFDRGHSVHEPPHGGLRGTHSPGGSRYYTYGGNWYRWRGGWYRWWGGGWVVWSAPIGLLVPLLPPYYTTVWWYGVPYYYANDTYYMWDADQDEYEVVAPPSGIESAGSTQPPPSDQLFAYPRNGQSEQQQKQDREECQQWAAAKTGFDPLVSTSPAEKRNDYYRAQVACLEGRGYTVR